MNITTRFIIIDDDETSNALCTITLKKMSAGVDVRTFTDPFEGFNHIVNTYSYPGEHFHAVLFLDLDMPVMDGWEFLSRFDKLDPAIKKRITVCILSAFNNRADIIKARTDQNVAHYITKPLNEQVIHTVTYTYNKDQ